jgi:8-oxo-dGTP diphosphatase
MENMNYNNSTDACVSKIMVQRIAAKALIINHLNQILLLREASTYQEGTNVGKYGLPGGRIEIGENYFGGLQREVKEETGLDIEIDKPIFVSEWFPVIRNVPHQIVGIFFACKAVTTDVVLSLEHDDYKWINPHEIEHYTMTSADYQAIEMWKKDQ